MRDSRRYWALCFWLLLPLFAIVFLTVDPDRRDSALSWVIFILGGLLLLVFLYGIYEGGALM